MAEPNMPVAILGVGPAGSAVGGALFDAGYEVVAAFSRSADGAGKALKAMGVKDVKGTADPVDAAKKGLLVLLAVPDKVVADLASTVAAGGGFRDGAIVAHLSGSLPSSVLEPAQLLGARIASMHPIKSFAGAADDRDFTGVCFGVEGEETAVAELVKVVKKLGGLPLKLRTEDKPIYHLSASIVSNFTVSLFHHGLQLMESIGVPRKVALPALTSLLRSTLDNITTLGVPKALTGPIARGDADTVGAHLEALKDREAGRLPLYAALARYTLEVAQEKGTLDVKEAEVLKSMLARYT
jgi:predicted short-subunit dehydrogenase-like oxidoreductase (DUF2520 family)